MGEAACYLISVGLGEAVLVFADGVDENVGDCDLAWLGAVPGDYGNRDAVGQIFTLTRIVCPLQDDVVPDTRFITLFLLLTCQQVQLWGVQPPNFTLSITVISLGPDLITVALDPGGIYVSAVHRPESA